MPNIDVVKSKFFEINKKRLDKLEDGMKKLDTEEKECYQRIKKIYYEEKSLLFKKIHRVKSDIQKVCPNLENHKKAEKQHRENGSGFRCQKCGYFVCEKDERL